VFEEFGPRAERTGAVLLTAFGYDYVPGNLAAVLALEAAGPAATRVRVGYFGQGNIREATSAGTRASAAGVLLEPGYAFRGGRVVRERTAARVMSFEIDEKTRQGFSIGSSEHFALPRLQPGADGVPAPLTDAAGCSAQVRKCVQPFAECGVEVKEVDCDDALGLVGEEFAPSRAGAARDRIDAGRVKDLPDSGDCDGVAEPGQLAVNPFVPSPGFFLAPGAGRAS
jgi:hypothetical protein